MDNSKGCNNIFMAGSNTSTAVNTTEAMSNSRQTPGSPPVEAILTNDRIIRNPPNAPRRKQKRRHQQCGACGQNLYQLLNLERTSNRVTSPMDVVGRLYDDLIEEEKKEDHSCPGFPSHLSIPDDAIDFEQNNALSRLPRLLPLRRKLCFDENEEYSTPEDCSSPQTYRTILSFEDYGQSLQPMHDNNSNSNSCNNNYLQPQLQGRLSSFEEDDDEDDEPLCEDENN